AETGGAEEITLTVSQIPSHTHPLTAANAPANSNSPSGTIPAQASANFYGPVVIGRGVTSAVQPTVQEFDGTVGGSQPHTNFMPYLAVNFIISLFGIFPSPT